MMVTEQDKKQLARGLPSNRKADLLRELFNDICDKKDWKNPIRAIVPSDLAPLYIEAIKFMTETEVVVVDQQDGSTLLESCGYQAGPAGDH